LALLAAAGWLLAAPAARADHHDANLPWPSLLPTLATPNLPQPHGVPNCRRARVGCIDRLVARLRRQYRRLDAACDHRVLFARSYLRITEELGHDLARRRPRLFRHKRWMILVISEFSNSYFRAYRNHERGGGPVPEPWRITFEEAAHGDAHAGQDVLLASNAHTQHDLPLAYAEMGLNTPAGVSRKHDHDAVNEVNSRLFDELEDEFAARYDPSFTLIDLKPSPLDEIGTMELVKSWREGAWRSAERLVAARTPEERRQAEDMVRTTSTLWAEFIRSGKPPPGWRTMRDAHCRATATR
jgi:hypothetical protein